MKSQLDVHGTNEQTAALLGARTPRKPGFQACGCGGPAPVHDDRDYKKKKGSPFSGPGSASTTDRNV
jgi:hypothetical protein